MLPATTPAVARAIEAARTHASERHVQMGLTEGEVEPVDLLHALLAEEDGRAATLAAQAGLEETYLNSLQAAQPTGPAAPLGRAMDRLLSSARELAFDLSGEAVITSEAALLAILRSNHAPFAPLVGHGLDLAQLESSLAGVTREVPPLEPAFQLADLTERVDTARVLDAGGNRAREALRIVEDYARFALDDAFLAGQCKQLRHELTAAFLEFAPPELLWSRETQHDVGTTLSAPREYRRESLREVAAANLKRLQEALRSIEEFAKVGHPLLARRVEAVRYQSYTLERALLLGFAARDQLRDVRLCALLSGAACLASLEWTIAEAAAGGVGMVQLREKNLSDRDLIARARQVRRWTRQAGVLFIVNDRADIARLVEADGVHLGQDDLSVKDGRRLVGAEALVGVSTHNIAQVRQAVLDGANYLGVGPVFASRTKSFDNLAGLDFVREASAETRLPTFVIGGIDTQTITEAIAAGATRAAVGNAVAAAEDPRQIAAVLTSALARKSV